MRKLLYILLPSALLLICHCHLAHSQDRRNYIPITPDSNVVHMMNQDPGYQESERVERFYDSLREKTSRSGFSKMLYQTLFRRPKKDTTMTGRIVDESKLYENFEGRTIANITIDRERMYTQDSYGIKKAINKMHVLTRNKTIRRDLLFRPGDKVDPEEIVRNMQIMQNRTYFANVEMSIIPYEWDSSMVEVVVWTKDTWSLSAAGKFRRDDKASFQIYDVNFLGYGNRLTLQTSINRKNFKYGGNQATYYIPNIMGSFYRSYMTVGKDFKDIVYQVSVDKPFIQPTDYMAGVSFNDNKLDYYMLYADSCDFVKYRDFDVWAGKSYYIPRLKSSIYFTGRYGKADYRERPYTTETVNPKFHDYDLALVGVGIYREKFYSANMIYGYGYREYLAAGYTLQFVGGYEWGEFSNNYYFGGSYDLGMFTTIGYFRGGMDIGGYVNSETGKWWRSAFSADLQWFSNLYRFRRTSMRQFLRLNHTRGWKRGERNDEVLGFTKDYGPRTITEWLTGRNRMVLNTETVFFTPYKPLGFRVAMFGFADFALLGNRVDIFKNQFFSTFGLGVRLKNERLVFNTIEIRLGLAVGKGGVLDNQFFKISNEQRVSKERFIPEAPAVVPFM